MRPGLPLLPTSPATPAPASCCPHFVLFLFHRISTNMKKLSSSIRRLSDHSPKHITTKDPEFEELRAVYFSYAHECREVKLLAKRLQDDIRSKHICRLPRFLFSCQLLKLRCSPVLRSHGEGVRGLWHGAGALLPGHGRPDGTAIPQLHVRCALRLEI